MYRLIAIFCFVCLTVSAEDGNRLWLRYERLPQPNIEAYTQILTSVCTTEKSKTIEITVNEFITAFQALTGKELSHTHVGNGNCLVLKIDKNSKNLTEGAFRIESRNDKGKQITEIRAKSDPGLLYGVFHLLRLMQTLQPIDHLLIEERPSYQRRILDHWDKLSGQVTRGYAGRSLWKWDELPDVISPRYKEYARANASVGINGSVLNSVNASPTILTADYIKKVAAIADEFRLYGIQVYLSVNFLSPSALGELKTSDPLEPEVRQWWKNKAKEIYAVIPDFGGFLLKANSESQSGPLNYGRTHLDGANMLAEALEPYGGIVMWRAFVYEPSSDDRAKEACREFIPFDGKFHPNVILQVKNGPIDFQPREPINPLFGNMQKTPLMIEFQITQEYLGFSDHLVYLAPLFKECLDTDTYAKGAGSTVAKVTNGTVFPLTHTAIAGVTNIGDNANWCGHHFAQSNWYAYGRLAWNPELRSETIASEWLRMTFSHDPEFIEPALQIMMSSREAAVNYRTPLGLHHIMSNSHYGIAPWNSTPTNRPDWNASYYHKADEKGIGFDRTTKGSNAVSLYFPPLCNLYNDINTCPENLLLFFHHCSWDYKMRSGKTLWDELCYRYDLGVNQVRDFQKIWDQIGTRIDKERFEAVQYKLKIQATDAVRWKSAGLLFFQTFSQKPIPYELERPVYDLNELIKNEK
jgi:alpha-glucuronidase